MNRGLLIVFALTLLASRARAQDSGKRFIYPGKDGKLVYDVDSRGNRIPDFSHCGYRGGRAIPDAPIRIVVSALKGDNGARIQQAIDHVAQLPPSADGMRGAVLLLTGRHEVAGHLRLHSSGIVLRGQKGTTLLATGTDRRTLIDIRGQADRTLNAPLAIADPYVPVGSIRLRLDSTAGLKPGDPIVVTHPSTSAWIAALGMNRFPSRDKGSYLDWIPGKMDVRFDRVITQIDGATITLDAPLTMALDARLSKCTVQAYAWPGRIANVGVEHFDCESAYESANPHDEEHAWNAISIENAENVWVRQMKFAHFAGSAVSVRESTRSVTIEDCESIRPISEIGGYRRHTFYTAGQLTLFRRCSADQGRHDFAVGYLAAGPNAFVDCQAKSAHQFSGPIESWATGVLYDRVTVDGGGLALTNRETEHQGVGWAAANCVLWQCTAPLITCRTPPAGQNWAIACWGQFVGDGHWRSLNQFVKPESLYAAQLAERLGNDAGQTRKRTLIATEPGSANTVDGLTSKGPARASKVMHPLALKNNWLVADARILTGGRTGTNWWRGHLLPSRAPDFDIGLTRFVPGRDGPGYTDDLEQVAHQMRARNQTILEHHWGLWYDRRRDDHQMMRRMDGEVWPPFLEQPWARSGEGQAWDGLSKFDLTKFNPWYFGRLKAFADQCEQHGLVLVQQMYFQHNLLEAGAHWADFPWRPANCLQATGFPEPPPYEKDKRIFMAEAFYDVAHPERRKLHRAYIRHCLDVLGRHANVIFQTGEEFTGPRAFVEFWLDTIAEWQTENRRQVLVSLSCTKDVQDAILADPSRAPLISVIDLRYWWYTANGGVYNPKAGESLAPRQQLRAWKGSKSRSDVSIARQVREYRERFPDKAILCSLDPAAGWAVLAAGGSIPHLPPINDAVIAEALPRMKPWHSKSLKANQWALSDPGRHYLVYSAAGETIRLDLSSERWAAYWINPKTGERKREAVVSGNSEIVFSPPGRGAAVLWLTAASSEP